MVFLQSGPSGNASLVPRVRAIGEARSCRALRITLKPRLTMLPRRRKTKAIAIRHLDLRKTLLVHDLVFPDDVVLVQEKRGEGINFIGFERPLFPQRHASINVIPDRRSEG